MSPDDLDPLSSCSVPIRPARYSSTAIMCQIPAAFRAGEPLLWWRRLGPYEWTPFTLEGLADRVLDLITPFDEPRWPAARAGDAAAAIGVVLRWDHPEVTPALVEALCASLIRPALAGDAAARLLLIRQLRRRAAFDPATARALAAWQALGHAAIDDTTIGNTGIGDTRTSNPSSLGLAAASQLLHPVSGDRVITGQETHHE